MRTLDEMIEGLLTKAECDDIILLLGIDTETLLNRFDDYVEANYTAVEEFLDEYS